MMEKLRGSISHLCQTAAQLVRLAWSGRCARAVYTPMHDPMLWLYLSVPTHKHACQYPALCNL